MSHNQGLVVQKRIMLDREAIQGRNTSRKRSIQDVDSIDCTGRRLNRLKAWCEEQGIKYRQIRGRDFADYLCDLYEAGYRYDYLRGAWTAFKYAFPVAAEKKRVQNVLANVRAEDDHTHKQAVSITTSEIDRLYAAIREPIASGRAGAPESEVCADRRARTYYVAFLFMFYCGLRSDEVTRIEWDHVTPNDDGGGTLYIEKSKGRYNDPYTKPIPPRIMYEWNLMRMASGRRKPFPTYRYLLRALKKADEVSGIKKGFTTHSFKVGMANLLVQKGYSLSKSLMRWVGSLRGWFTTTRETIPVSSMRCGKSAKRCHYLACGSVPSGKLKRHRVPAVRASRCCSTCCYNSPNSNLAYPSEPRLTFRARDEFAFVLWPCLGIRAEG